MKYLYLIIIVLLLFLTGCSPKPIYDLKPYNEEAEYEQGRLVAVKVDSLYETAVNFELHADDHLVFFSYFYNGNDEPILIDPADCYIKTYSSKIDFAFDKRAEYFSAYDPENEIDRAAIDLHNTQEGYDAMTGLNCLFGAIGLISAASDDDEDIDDAVETVLIWTDNQIGIEAGREMAEEEFERKRAFWQNEVLRKSTLKFDEEIGGMIHFPVNEEAKFIRLFVSLGETEHIYSFEQILINE